MSFRKYSCLSAAFLFALCSSTSPINAQRSCGQEVLFKNLRADNPAQYQKMKDSYQADLEDISVMESGTAQFKTAAASPIPVVFHFVLTTPQYNALGNDTGIKRRVASQLRVLNQDFNRGNADSTAIPAAFKSRYGNPAIKFARAGGVKNSYAIAGGIEVKLLASTTTFSADDMCAAAKNPTTGLAAWDPDKYLNVWIVKITNSGAGAILGVTTPPYLVGYTVGGHLITANEKGIAMSYGAFGARDYPIQYFTANADRGRTFTHEMGHYFELIHIWGDDDNSDTVTRCTTYSGGFDDDMVGDTPPQGKRTYCDFPNHASNNCPTFPLLDKCSPNSPGVMYMNYMDYVTDTAMHMFSVGQATRMNYYLTQESSSLTQHPELLGVDDAKAEMGEVALAPNPSNGLVRLNLERAEGFKGAVVVNMMGQTIKNIIAVPGVKSYNFDLSNAPRGIYLVQCHYDGGTVTQKLVLE
jgi:hypothetical protein